MKKILLLLVVITIFVYSQDYDQIISKAYLNDYGYQFLQQVCDRFGGRLMGNKNNFDAFDFLAKDFENNKIEYKIEYFDAPSYIRDEENVEIVYPFKRKLKIATIGYSKPIDKTTAEVVLLKTLKDTLQFGNKILLYVKSEFLDKELPLKYELCKILNRNKALGLLVANDNTGYTNLVSTGDFKGRELDLPVFTITNEDAQILTRQVNNSLRPVVSIFNKSFTKIQQVPNIVASYKGKSKDKIVLISHFDSWDLGQGAIDNGIGSANLYHILRVFYEVKPKINYSIDFVFVNGEELGLFGSKAYYEKHKNENLVACINMDMVGSPYGFNVMGYDSLKTLIEQFNNLLKGFNLNKVISHPWLNSDHMPFMINGIPSITPLSKLDEFKIQYYHDYTDTFEKVNKKAISDAGAVIGSLLYHLAIRNDLEQYKLDKSQTNKMLEKFNLLKQLENE
ncbi:MAG TPA: M28 family peptidase [Ignavibacteriales bacterium]|nr:M28 family peptidase [Ignavibacteriales bacterium]HOL80876.1 M28 family peptidase [Ignavibacteriales bacterium]HPP33311.1 M28 family peptidase [Ignavibacteriales bacterium]